MERLYLFFKDPGFIWSRVSESTRDCLKKQNAFGEMKKDEDEQEFEVYHFVTGNPKFLK